MSPETLIELVNGWGTVPRRADGRGDTPYPDSAELEERLGVRVGDRVLAEVSDRLHPVFAAPDAAERARLVAALLSETEVRPTLGVDGDRVHAGWLVRKGRNAVLAAAAVALREYLANHDFGRLGVCVARGCADVYVDTSPGGRRRFCSVTCQTRARVAAFRNRQT